MMVHYGLGTRTLNTRKLGLAQEKIDNKKDMEYYESRLKDIGESLLNKETAEKYTGKIYELKERNKEIDEEMKKPE